MEFAILEASVPGHSAEHHILNWRLNSGLYYCRRSRVFTPNSNGSGCK